MPMVYPNREITVIERDVPFSYGLSLFSKDIIEVVVSTSATTGWFIVFWPFEQPH